MVVREYLDQLKETRKGKPAQIRDALDIYVETVGQGRSRTAPSRRSDEVALALSKIDKAGGLYEAAGARALEWAQWVTSPPSSTMPCPVM